MNKQVDLTEKLAYRILMFFTRHLGFSTFHTYSLENRTWHFEFCNSSNRVEITRIFNDTSNTIRFDHNPTCKDIVNELLTCASKGERIASMTSSYHTATLMQPFMTIEELLVKMDLELSYEQ